VLRAFSSSNGQLSAQPVAKGQPILSVHGATVSISSNGSNNGIVWEIDNTNHDNGGRAILRAYDASNISNELYDNTQAGSRDTAGGEMNKQDSRSRKVRFLGVMALQRQLAK
jgi:hypothetical protein